MGLFKICPRICISSLKGKIRFRLEVIFATKRSPFPAQLTTEAAEERQADGDNGEEHFASRERGLWWVTNIWRRHFVEHIGKGDLPRYQLICPLLFKI